MTTEQYLTQLQTDKSNLVANLVEKGVEASDSETFTSLVPKVLDIQSGGGEEGMITFSNFNANGLPKKVKINNVPNDSTRGNFVPGYLLYSNANYGEFNYQYFYHLEEIQLPNNVDTLETYCFYNLTNLKKINLDNVKIIRNYAFNQCMSLDITQLPNVTYMDYYSLRNCSALKKLSLPSIEQINADNTSAVVAANLKRVWVGSSITSEGFGKKSFGTCPKLEALYIDLPRATVETFTNYQYAFMNDANKINLIICNDDEGFLTLEEFEALEV